MDSIDYFSQLLTLGLHIEHLEKVKFVLFLGFGFKVPI